MCKLISSAFIGQQSVFQLRRATSAFTGCLLLVLSTAALAQTTATRGICYASTGTVDGGRLLTIDLNTGAGTLIGPQNGMGPRLGLAINSSGEIFVSDTLDFASLFRIDAATGEQSFIGTGATGGFRDGIAFDENDVLYGASFFADPRPQPGVSPSKGVLFTIDTATGAETPIALTQGAIVGLAFDPSDGTLYASQGGVGGDNIFAIDKKTGAATLVGQTGLGGPTPDIAFDAAGNLYGLKGGGQSTNNLISINKSTGVGTVIGPIGFRSVSGLDCFTGPTAKRKSIPWWMLLLDD